MPTLAIVFALALAANVHGAPMLRSHITPSGWTDKIHNEWTKWKDTHNKTYGHDELYRMKVFYDNLMHIVDHNSKFSMGHQSYSLGLNQFADLTNDEWRVRYLQPVKQYGQVVDADLHIVSLPDTTVSTMDWRQKGVVTPVKNQGQCGSCWSFSTTGSVEGAWALSNGTLVSLSEQQLVDCSTSFGNQGCNGGLMDDAFEYVIQNGGLDSESDYPYTASDGKCNHAKEKRDVASITSFNDVPRNNEQQLKNAVAQQPVSVAIEADKMSFQFYKSGVFTAPCGTNLDHGVLVVGYGSENGQDYWIVKNSWGSTWGDEGYILLARNVDADEGQCGVAMQPSYPVV